MNTTLFLMSFIALIFLSGGVVAYSIRKVFDLVAWWRSGDYITTGYVVVRE